MTSPLVLPAVLPDGNAQDSTEQHERPQERLRTWTTRHKATPDGLDNTNAARLIIRCSVRLDLAPYLAPISSVRGRSH
jgi:hypothetical protein